MVFTRVRTQDTRVVTSTGASSRDWYCVILFQYNSWPFSENYDSLRIVNKRSPGRLIFGVGNRRYLSLYSLPLQLDEQS